MISYVNSFPIIQPWFHNILHSIASWIHIWIHDNEFIYDFIMLHFMTYEFIYEFMYVKNIVKSYLNSCVPRFQMGVAAFFHQASLSLPALTAVVSETPCVCARLSNPPNQCQRAAPRAWPLISPSKPSITFWNSLRSDCQMTGRGSNLDSKSQTWTLCPDQQVVKFLLPPKSQHKLCGFWILFKSVTDAKFEPSKLTFLRLMPSTGLLFSTNICLCSRGFVCWLCCCLLQQVGQPEGIMWVSGFQVPLHTVRI